MTRSCTTYKSFAVGQRATENRLNEATVAVQSQNQNQNVTTHQVRHADEGHTLVKHSQKRKRAGPGRPSGTTVAARAPGQQRLQLSASQPNDFMFGISIPTFTTPTGKDTTGEDMTPTGKDNTPSAQ
ncbi:hypothetical protein P152DRAFT_477732 [Eremomyces bilateralis CBS 781.70]|uniref:Uncharacterized protein n=1 Tax=Eremomyces bilateralis CBS 781.70 TaxID=1392243 RepID=A0A6G1FQ48_9PEZI|nr:uncharacterized protein P152DRAFT_477732 [Eremomyces bilateralis CBS 781.70]KAF1807955.1 hypothetical protein P152DRAFT_477732 [Eremomyces bilateralis CBS 781.70]